MPCEQARRKDGREPDSCCNGLMLIGEATMACFAISLLVDVLDGLPRAIWAGSLLGKCRDRLPNGCGIQAAPGYRNEAGVIEAPVDP